MNDLDLDMADITAMADAATAPVRDVKQEVRNAINAGSDIPTHPAAELYPMMNVVQESGTPDDRKTMAFTKLVEDIIASGVHESIKIDEEGTLLDGRNRIAALREAFKQGKKPTFTVEIVSPKDQSQWITSLNMHRRHLSTSQRAVVAMSMINSASYAKETGTTPVSTEDAAKIMKVSEPMVQNVKRLRREKPEVVKKIAEGKTTVSAEVSTLNQEVKAEKVVKKAVAKAKMQKVREDIAQISGLPKPAPLPDEPAPVPKARKPRKIDGLTKDELEQLKTLCKKANQAQLIGVQAYIKGMAQVIA